jgi:CheY-like chemotaxis protein
VSTCAVALRSRRRQYQVRGLLSELDKADRRKDEFLAMLAHELRNPLVPLSMSASLLERPPLAGEHVRRLTQVIRRQVDHMAHLLDDLLDAARISSGKIRLSVEPLEIGAIVEQAVETVLPRIRERGQELVVELSDGEVAVDGDRVRLIQVLSNLLGNASKYTQDGGRIALEVEAGADVTITISDNGAGIAPEVLPHIFDLFTQGPRSLARSEGGLGIGLNVVRNIVAMHGGAVTADSGGPRQGSSFVVRLPRSSAAPVRELPPAESGAGRAHKILLVEDNLDACQTLRMLLEAGGHQVDVAHDGASGLAAACSGAYDVLVCDVGLPGMDGFELVERLRAATSRMPFAIALSGYGQAEDRERAIACGFDRYLVKPATAEILFATLAELPA